MENSNPSELLQPFRNELYLLAQSQISGRLHRKLDADDLVQETMARAYQKVADLPDSIEPQEVKRWLIVILSNVLKDQMKHYATEKRDLRREQFDACELEKSAMRLEAFLVSEQTSPSLAVAKKEKMEQLASALRLLSEDIRDVVLLKHIHGMTLKQISEHTQRTPASIAGLLRRGLAQLRHHID